MLTVSEQRAKMDKDVTGRLEDEIEVTEEMIEAGVLELYEYDPYWGNQEEVVESIFRAMLNICGAASSKLSSLPSKTNVLSAGPKMKN